MPWGPGKPRRRTSEANWGLPRRWNRRAARDETEPRVFCASLADVFDHEAPAGALDDLWNLIDETPLLRWLLLTKRPERIMQSLPFAPDWQQITRQHVWLGVSAENQEMLEKRWPILAAVRPRPAVRFISYEPALGPISIPVPGTDELPDWIIVGGESGRHAREMDTEWVVSLIRQCAEHGIPLWFKQWGTAKSWPGDPAKGGNLVCGASFEELPVERL